MDVICDFFGLVLELAVFWKITGVLKNILDTEIASTFFGAKNEENMVITITK